MRLASWRTRLRKLWDMLDRRILHDNICASSGRVGDGRRVLRDFFCAIDINLSLSFSTNNLLQLPGQLVVLALILAYLFHGLPSISCVKLLDQLWKQMDVLDGFLDCRHGRTRGLALPRGWTVAILGWGVGFAGGDLIVLDLFFQEPQIKIPQGIRSQAILVV